MVIVAFRRQHSCRWMIACMPCSRPFHISPDLHCIVACNGMGSAGYQRLKVTSRRRRSSDTRLGLFMSTLRKSELVRIKSACLGPSTARPGLLMSNSMRRQGNDRSPVLAQAHRSRALQNPHDLTDNGIQFTNRKRGRLAFEHIFSRICRENGIDQRLTRVNHPWTNGQIERMNRTIKEAMVITVSLQYAFSA